MFYSTFLGAGKGHLLSHYTLLPSLCDRLSAFMGCLNGVLNVVWNGGKRFPLCGTSSPNRPLQPTALAS